MQNTENFNLKVYDGEDLFNPLTVENVNMNSIDTQMKKNENHIKLKEPHKRYVVMIFVHL